MVFKNIDIVIYDRYDELIDIDCIINEKSVYIDDQYNAISSKLLNRT